MALTLRGCREEAGLPTFGLCSTVIGEFEPTDREKIISVVAKVRANILQRRLSILNAKSARRPNRDQNQLLDIFHLVSFQAIYPMGE